jgi:hypothetical protein
VSIGFNEVRTNDDEQRNHDGGRCRLQREGCR